MVNKLFLVFLIISTLPVYGAEKDTTEIRFFQTDERYAYRIKLLDLALSKTKEKVEKKFFIVVKHLEKLIKKKTVL